MTFDDCIREVSDRLTVSGSLPLYINEAEISRIITRTKDWFFINYNRVQEQRYYMIRYAALDKQKFKENRTIVMPDCVISVARVIEEGSNIRFAGVGKELTIDRLVATELLFNRNSSGDLVALTARLAYIDLLKAFYSNLINFDFNYNSKKLVITGKDISRDTIIKAYVKVEDHFLYEDPYFLRFCTAEARLSTARVLGAFDVNMPGGVKLNGERFSTEGAEEINKVKEEILASQPPDSFAMFA